jgi:hypothetical protein
MKNSNEFKQTVHRFFNTNRSPIGTANDKTVQKKFERNRDALIHDSSQKGTFYGNLRRTYKF